MAVRPIDAATVLPLRRVGSALQVLMGRRSRAHRFMPDFYVFPGGRLDAADAARLVQSELRPEVAARLAAHCSVGRGRALAIAAARELHEETGLAIGTLDGVQLRPALDRLEFILRAITPPQSPMRFHARFFTVMVEPGDGAPCGNGELLDLDWRPIEACLRLPIADITEYALRELDRLPGDEGVPLFSFRSRQVWIRAHAGTATRWIRPPRPA